MKVTAISMAKDEADIIGFTVENMLTQVDEVIVANNLSKDNTAEIARDAGAIVVEDNDPAYYQSKKMTALAGVAAERGAEWIVPFDADEVWISLIGGTISDALNSQPQDVNGCNAKYFDFKSSYLDDIHEINPLKRINYRERIPTYEKVACRWKKDLIIAQGNHFAHYGNEQVPTVDSILEIRHYQYRSVEQYLKKVINGNSAYLAAPDLPYGFGTHWRVLGDQAEKNKQEAINNYLMNETFDSTRIDLAVYDPWEQKI